jgi:hypothetical protein
MLLEVQGRSIGRTSAAGCGSNVEHDRSSFEWRKTYDLQQCRRNAVFASPSRITFFESRSRSTLLVLHVIGGA